MWCCVNVQCAMMVKKLNEQESVLLLIMAKHHTQKVKNKSRNNRNSPIVLVFNGSWMRVKKMNECMQWWRRDDCDAYKKVTVSYAFSKEFGPTTCWPCSLTSMRRAAPGSSVLIMWTFGVEVERCLWRDWMSSVRIKKLKEELGDIASLQTTKHTFKWRKHVD